MFQEILTEGYSQYSHNLKEFLEDADTLCLYQSKFRGGREKSFGGSEVGDAVRAIVFSLKVIGRLRSEGASRLEVFLLKSIEREDIIVLFKNFDSMETVRSLKSHFSEELTHSLTTIFFKGPSTRGQRIIRLDSSRIVTLLKVENYGELSNLGESKYGAPIVTGSYDCMLEWGPKLRKTIEDADRLLFKFINEWNERLGIIDINSAVSFSPKKTDGIREQGI